MRRGFALLALALLLAAPLAGAGSWLQPRGDAAATGFQPGDGPEHPDVALRVQMNGSMRAEYDAPPLILEDQVVFLAREYGDAYDGTYQVYSMDIETGNLRTVGELGVAAALQVATDGETVYAAGQRSVHAFPLEPDGEEWTWSWEPRTDASAFYVGCESMTLDRGHVTVLCFEDADVVAGCSGCGPQGSTTVGAQAGLTDMVLVARLDAETGEPAWVWDNPDPGPNTTRDGQPETRVFPEGIAVSGGQVVVQTVEGKAVDGVAVAGTQGQGAGAFALAGQARIVVRGLSADDGSLAWNEPWRSAPFNLTAYPTPGGDPAGLQELPRIVRGPPAASQDTVYVKARGIRSLNLGTGETIWHEPVGKEDTQPGLGGGTGLALAEGQVHATTSQTLYGLQASDPEDRWSKSLALSADRGFDEAPIVTRDAVYVGTFSPDESDSVYAFSPEDGDVRWRHDLDGNLQSFSVAGGLLALTENEFGDSTANTTIVILGETEASLDPAASVSTTYPDPGEPVRVDLSGSEAGLKGPATKYKATWGDGNTTGWRSEPVLTHSYNDTGGKTARFVVGNDANQTASTTETFHVGQEPPREPNLAQKAFAQENQDMTFGIIGIVLALGGGIIGVGRRYHKRSRLQQELDALEEGFEDTRQDPGECEAFLDNRKGRARSLALDGKLNEEQAGIVEDRAEELRRELRQGAVEEEFGFLPYELVMKARRMLEDGEFTELEAEAFLQALEEVEMIGDEQRALVRERIEDWYGHDAGGGGAG